MKTIWETIARFFRPSQNDRFAQLLLQLAETAVACAAHFRETGGLDHVGIIDFEHRGDDIVAEIHELLDNAFILRFDIADCMRLTDDLDNVIDGMRKVAIHIDIYKPVVAPLRPEAMELFAIGERMMSGVRQLVSMLGEPRLSLSAVRFMFAATTGPSQNNDGIDDAYRAKYGGSTYLRRPESVGGATHEWLDPRTSSPPRWHFGYCYLMGLLCSA